MPNHTDKRLTSVVRSLLSEQRPMGAYRIAQILEQQTGRAGYANTVYRIIAPMVRAGEVVALVTVKGWILADPRLTNRMILLCSKCQTARQIQAENPAAAVHVLCAEHGFMAQQTCVEVVGLCQLCRSVAD